MKADAPALHGGTIHQLAARLNINPADLVDFSSSLNPLGPPSAVQEILSHAQGIVAPYPDTSCWALREAIGRQANLAPDTILVGNGTTELIFLIARALRPGMTTVICPTFSEYERAALWAGSRMGFIILRREENFSWNPSPEDLPLLAASDLCFVCNPNNPTGSVVSAGMLRGLLASCPKTVFVVDEAFVDFLDNPDEISVLRDCGTARNLIVLRSFTKFFSIAGLRLGYAAAHPSLIQKLEGLKEPWTVNALAQAVGVRLMDQKGYAAATRRWLGVERERLMRELRGKTRLVPLESRVNYLLLRIESDTMRAGELFEMLLRRRIVVRDASNFRGLDPSFIRVAVKSAQHNGLLVSCLQELLPAQAIRCGAGAVR